MRKTDWKFAIRNGAQLFDVTSLARVFPWSLTEFSSRKRGPRSQSVVFYGGRHLGTLFDCKGG